MRSWVELLVVALLVSSCGGGRSEEPAASGTAPATTAPVASLEESADDGTGPVAEVPDELSAVFVLAAGGDGTLVAGSSRDLWVRDPAGRWSPVDLAGLPTGPEVTLDDFRRSGEPAIVPGRALDGVAIDGDGRLWLAGRATTSPPTTDGWGWPATTPWLAHREITPGSGMSGWTVLDPADVVDGGTASLGDLAVGADGDVVSVVDGWRVVRFDGESWEIIQVDPGWPDDPTSEAVPWGMAPAVDADGTIWVSLVPEHTRTGLVSIDGSTVRWWTEDDGLPFETVIDLAPAPDGTLWAAGVASEPTVAGWPGPGAFGVAHLRDGAWTTYSVDDGLLSDYAFVTVGSDVTVWAAHLGWVRGFSRFDGERWTAVEMDPASGSGGGAMAWPVATDGAVWSAEGRTILRCDGNTIEVDQVLPTP